MTATCRREEERKDNSVMTKPKLYGARVSPYYERVWLALDIKGHRDSVEEAGVPGGMPQSPEYRRVTPIGKIPALQLPDGQVIPESDVICRFIERAHPDPALFPEEPRAAAAVDLVARIADLYVAPALGTLFQAMRENWSAGEQLDAATSALVEALAKLEHFFTITPPHDDSGWTYADCTLLPLAFYFQLAANRFGFDPFARAPRVKAWYEGIMRTPRAQRSHQGMQASLAELMKRMQQDNG